MWVIPWLVEELLASQEVLCYTVWVSLEAVISDLPLLEYKIMYCNAQCIRNKDNTGCGQSTGIRKKLFATRKENVS